MTNAVPEEIITETRTEKEIHSPFMPGEKADDSTGNDIPHFFPARSGNPEIFLILTGFSGPSFFVSFAAGT